MKIDLMQPELIPANGEETSQTIYIVQIWAVTEEWIKMYADTDKQAARDTYEIYTAVPPQKGKKPYKMRLIAAHIEVTNSVLLESS